MKCCNFSRSRRRTIYLFKGHASSEDVTQVKWLRRGHGGDKLMRCKPDGLRRLKHREEVKQCYSVLSISLRDQQFHSPKGSHWWGQENTGKLRKKGNETGESSERGTEEKEPLGSGVTSAALWIEVLSPDYNLIWLGNTGKKISRVSASSPGSKTPFLLSGEAKDQEQNQKRNLWADF